MQAVRRTYEEVLAAFLFLGGSMVTIVLFFLLISSFVGLCIALWASDDNEYDAGYKDGYDAGWIDGQEHQRIRSYKEGETNDG